MTINKPSPAHISQLRALWQEAFGDSDAFLDTFFTTAYRPDRCRCVTVDGQVAAALYWFRCSHMGQPVAYIYAVATAKAFRGRGLCRMLMENTHAHLENLGYAGTVLVPGSESLFRLYAGFGYRVCSGICEIITAPDDRSIPVHRVAPEVYARLRRELLPSGGIVQEGENLDFLQTQATLYAGPKFLLAARQEGAQLYGLELLGDTGAAPGILSTLGCESGTFRVPGDTPFAMYRPLGESILPMPEYFGLAFD